MAWPIFRRLFDDASLFPPASLPMANAVAGHLHHQAAWYREMSGPFVCADTKITELSAALTAAGVTGLDLALVLPGGAAGLDAAVDGVLADPRLRLRAVELPRCCPRQHHHRGRGRGCRARPDAAGRCRRLHRGPGP